MSKRPQTKKILILCKTYPSPSQHHIETSCVAGMDEDGHLIRLYPVPFRFIDGNKRFQKWQWITAGIIKATKDHRVESHNIFVDTIELGEQIPTKNEWIERRHWLSKLPLFTDFTDIQPKEEASKVSLAVLKPARLERLEIIATKNPNWTAEELAKLLQAEQQAELFVDETATQSMPSRLEKIPYDFYYHYICLTPEGEKAYKHKLVDWEVGALFRKCQKDYGDTWEKYFRIKLETEFAQKDLFFLMGNQHRFQNQWLIISLIYPPKQQPEALAQGQLF